MKFLGPVIGEIPRLRRFARSLVGNTAEADDLVQDCLMRVLTYKHRLEQVQNLRAYLFKVLYSAHLDRIAQLRQAAPCIPLEEVEPSLACPPRQHRQLELREVASALEALPPEQREVLILIALAGTSYRSAAKILGIPIGTVTSRLARGRKTLRRLAAGKIRNHLPSPLASAEEI